MPYTFLLKSITLDFDAIELVMKEEDGKYIDWDGCPCESDIRKWIYGVIEEDVLEWFESGDYGHGDLQEKICEKLIHYCEENDVRIVEPEELDVYSVEHDFKITIGGDEITGTYYQTYGGGAEGGYLFNGEEVFALSRTWGEEWKVSPSADEFEITSYSHYGEKRYKLFITRNE
jgi:hypothetical protein